MSLRELRGKVKATFPEPHSRMRAYCCFVAATGLQVLFTSLGSTQLRSSILYFGAAEGSRKSTQLAGHMQDDGGGSDGGSLSAQDSRSERDREPPSLSCSGCFFAADAAFRPYQERKRPCIGSSGKEAGAVGTGLFPSHQPEPRAVINGLAPGQWIFDGGKPAAAALLGRLANNRAPAFVL